MDGTILAYPQRYANADVNRCGITAGRQLHINLGRAAPRHSRICVARRGDISLNEIVAVNQILMHPPDSVGDGGASASGKRR